MSWTRKAALAAALLNCALSSGLAAPASGTENPSGDWLKDAATGCQVLDADARGGDAVHWTGSCVDGKASGLGTASFTSNGADLESFTGTFAQGLLADGPVVTRWGHGWSYEGEAVGGRFNGAGVLTTDTADRFEGSWTDGRMNGFGVLRRASGERYAGDWKNDKPNGNGELRRADGSLVAGQFVDGKLIKADAPASLLKASDTTTAAQPQTGAPFGGVSGKTLTAVDGSTIALNLIEGGMELQVGQAEGAARKTTFTFMTDRMGTVVENNSANAGASVTGFFRLTDKGVEVRYADGRSAMLAPNGNGGVEMALDTGTATSCQSWYPAGHAFSEAEKKEALNAYAGKLGLPTTAGQGGCSSSAQIANLPIAQAPAPAVATPASVAKAHADHHGGAHLAKASYRIGDYAGAPADGATVKASTVHVIDGPVDASPVTVSAIAALPVLSAAAPSDSKDASHCLSVDSDGGHWGFRNACSYAVQFSYCLKDGSSSLSACGAGAVAGSVAASGFGALIADASLGEKDVSHKFRWVACGGGAGEVVAHLDHFDPPGGRCERTATASN